jgi:hypothetical protein
VTRTNQRQGNVGRRLPAKASTEAQLAALMAADSKVQRERTAPPLPADPDVSPAVLAARAERNEEYRRRRAQKRGPLR